MVINGFQKLTLLDFPGRTAAIVFTAGCDLRCPFCHNAGLVSRIRAEERIDEAEIFSYLERRRGLLDGVVISGGEPLLHKDVSDFILRLRALGYAIKLDTNGSSPEALERLVRGGLLDYVAMDVKNAPDLYPKTTGIAGLDVSAFTRSKDFLLSGEVDYEFRTTVSAELHTPESIAAAAEWISGAERYFIQNFKDSGDLVGEGLHPCTEQTLLKMRAAAEPFVKSVAVR